MSDTQPVQETGEDILFLVAAQYIKDLSFESPGAPHSLQPNEVAPQINVQVDMAATAVGENGHEVALSLTVDARRGEEQLFLVELTYAGIFVITGVPEAGLRPLLLIEGPKLLFPFARSVISAAVRDGGFPPLLLQPVDFAALYRQSLDGDVSPEATPDP